MAEPQAQQADPIVEVYSKQGDIYAPDLANAIRQRFPELRENRDDSYVIRSFAGANRDVIPKEWLARKIITTPSRPSSGAKGSPPAPPPSRGGTSGGEKGATGTAGSFFEGVKKTVSTPILEDVRQPLVDAIHNTPIPKAEHPSTESKIAAGMPPWRAKVSSFLAGDPPKSGDVTEGTFFPTHRSPAFPGEQAAIDQHRSEFFKGVEEGMVDVGVDLSSPTNLAMLAASYLKTPKLVARFKHMVPLAKLLLSGKFAWDSMDSMSKEFPAVAEAKKKGDYEAAGRHFSKAVGDLVFAVQAAKGITREAGNLSGGAGKDMAGGIKKLLSSDDSGGTAGGAPRGGGSPPPGGGGSGPEADITGLTNSPAKQIQEYIRLKSDALEAADKLKQVQGNLTKSEEALKKLRDEEFQLRTAPTPPKPTMVKEGNKYKASDELKQKQKELKAQEDHVARLREEREPLMRARDEAVRQFKFQQDTIHADPTLTSRVRALERRAKGQPSTSSIPSPPASAVPPSSGPGGATPPGGMPPIATQPNGKPVSRGVRSGVTKLNLQDMTTADINQRITELRGQMVPGLDAGSKGAIQSIIDLLQNRANELAQQQAATPPPPRPPDPGAAPAAPPTTPPAAPATPPQSRNDKLRDILGDDDDQAPAVKPPVPPAPTPPITPVAPPPVALDPSGASSVAPPTPTAPSKPAEPSTPQAAPPNQPAAAPETPQASPEITAETADKKTEREAQAEIERLREENRKLKEKRSAPKKAEAPTPPSISSAPAPAAPKKSAPRAAKPAAVPPAPPPSSDAPEPRPETTTDKDAAAGPRPEKKHLDTAAIVIANARRMGSQTAQVTAVMPDGQHRTITVNPKSVDARAIAEHLSGAEGVIVRPEGQATKGFYQTAISERSPDEIRSALKSGKEPTGSAAAAAPPTPRETAKPEAAEPFEPEQNTPYQVNTKFEIPKGENGKLEVSPGDTLTWTGTNEDTGESSFSLRRADGKTETIRVDEDHVDAVLEAIKPSAEVAFDPTRPDSAASFWSDETGTSNVGPGIKRAWDKASMGWWVDPDANMTRVDSTHAQEVGKILEAKGVKRVPGAGSIGQTIAQMKKRGYIRVRDQYIDADAEHLDSVQATAAVGKARDFAESHGHDYIVVDVEGFPFVHVPLDEIGDFLKSPMRFLLRRKNQEYLRGEVSPPAARGEAADA